MYTKVKTHAEIAAMRSSGRMLATVLDVLKQALEPGMTTKFLADIAASELRKLGGEPAFLGYHGFPDVICISLNDEVVHGIPNANIIVQSGDLVSLDFGVKYGGMITDSAITVVAGTSNDNKIQALIQCTEQAMLEGIEQLEQGVRVGTIANAIQKKLEKQHYGIVRDLVGHGVGHHLHEEPNIPNFGRTGTGDVLEAGMTIAIEPMAALGGHRVVLDPDGWTIRTADGSLSAHFEHTILITESGYEILTTL